MPLALNALLLFLLQAPNDDVPALRHELYRAQMAAAESAMRLDESAIAREWLDATPRALRGFEWHVHDAELDQSLATVPTGNVATKVLALSPDGTTLACGLADGRIELRSADGSAVLASLDAHRDAVTDLGFDAAGKRLVSASLDRTVRIHDVATKTQLVEFKGHGFPVGGATFSPDGALVASCSYERPPNSVVGTMHLWNAADGTVVRSFQGGRKPLVGIEFSPDGKRIAAGSWDFCVFVWSVDGGEPTKCAVPDEGIYNAVDGVAWTPDGRFVAGASKDKTARVWNPATGEVVYSLRGHTDFVARIVCSDDGGLFATASHDGTVRLWNVSDGTLRSVLRGHTDDVHDVVFTHDGSHVVSVSSDRTLRRFDARTTLYSGLFVVEDGTPYAVRFRPDDARLAIASYDGRITIRDAASLAPLISWQAHPKEKSCHALAWTPDGKRLLSGSWEPVVRLFDAEDGREVASFAQQDGTYHVAISPDGTRATSCAGSRVVVYDLAGKKKLHDFEGHKKTVFSANFSPDGKRIASAADDGKIHVFDTETGAVLSTIVGPNLSMAEGLFLRDGKSLVAVGRGGAVTLHDTASGAKLRELARLRHGVSFAELSPDERRLALASSTIVLVDLERGGVVGELRRNGDKPYDLDFDAAGGRLASCAHGRIVGITDRRPLRNLLDAPAGR